MEQNWYLLGEGSNTVFTENYNGIVVRMSNKGKTLVETEDDYLLNIKAGENWHQLIVWCLDKGINGFENLALIPGSVGAAPIQNIGAYGVEIERFVESVEYLDLSDRQLKILNRGDCQFDYRNSIFKQSLAGNAIITSVNFKLPKAWKAEHAYNELSVLKNPTARQIFESVINVRSQKLPDPSQMGNAGSFFKNPIIRTSQYKKLQHKWQDMPGYQDGASMVKIPAAWLIDKLGFKGKKLGGITCHPSQPLVLTNNGQGTGDELLTMARSIKADVFECFDIELENEVRLVGEEGLISL